VWTIHAEFEGSAYFPQFHEFVEEAEREGDTWVFLPERARELLASRERVPCDTIQQGTLPGRAGTVTKQGTGNWEQGTGIRHTTFAVPRSPSPDN
jgi:hypothetical protein